MSIQIAPSILSADFCNLERDIQAVSSGDMLHIDVMDGIFVPNITVGIPVVASIRKKTDMILDVHMMVIHPHRYVEAFAQAGADMISIHLEADTPENIGIALEKIRKQGVKAGIVLRPLTGAQGVIPYLQWGIDYILVMTVEPGQGGQSFLPDQLPKIRDIRRFIDQYHPICDLQVDGGIHQGTAKEVIDAGANLLVSGSAIYASADPAATIAQLRG